jgi:hypothetical protein
MVPVSSVEHCKEGEFSFKYYTHKSFFFHTIASGQLVSLFSFVREESVFFLLSSCLRVPLFQNLKQINYSYGSWNEGYTVEVVIILSNIRQNMAGARAYEAGAITSSHTSRPGNYVSQYILQKCATSVK